MDHRQVPLANHGYFVDNRFILLNEKILRRETIDQKKIGLFLIFLMGVPYRNVLSNGQHSVFATVFFLLSIILDKRNNKLAFLPISIALFKFTLTLPLSIVYIKKKSILRNISFSAVFILTLYAITSLITNSSIVDLIKGELNVIKTSVGLGPIDLISLLHRLNVSNSYYYVGVLFLTVIIILITIKDDDSVSLVSTLSIAAGIITYHPIYDYVVLVFPLFFLYAHTNLSRKYFSIRALYYLMVLVNLFFLINISDWLLKAKILSSVVVDYYDNSLTLLLICVLALDLINLHFNRKLEKYNFLDLFSHN